MNDFEHDSDDRTEEWDDVVRVFGGHSGSGWIRANCPRCGPKTGKDDQKQSMGLNTETGGYNCFKCGTRGKLPEFLLEEVPYMPRDADAPPIVKPPPEPIDQFFPLFLGPHAEVDWLENFRTYFYSRGAKRTEGGLTAEVGAQTYVGAALTGKRRGRLIVPLPDYGPDATWELHRWRGFVARDVTAWLYGQDLGPAPDQFAIDRPYLYNKGLDREAYLYGEPALWVTTDEPVFVVEGTLDALALWPDAVAVLGKPLESQIEKLADANRPVVIALDGDAWEEGWLLSMKLRFMGQRAGALKFAPRLDPDEVDAAVLREAAKYSLLTQAPIPVGF